MASSPSQPVLGPLLFKGVGWVVGKVVSIGASLGGKAIGWGWDKGVTYVRHRVFKPEEREEYQVLRSNGFSLSQINTFHKYHDKDPNLGVMFKSTSLASKIVTDLFTTSGKNLAILTSVIKNPNNKFILKNWVKLRKNFDTNFIINKISISASGAVIGQHAGALNNLFKSLSQPQRDKVTDNLLKATPDAANEVLRRHNLLTALGKIDPEITVSLTSPSFSKSEFTAITKHAGNLKEFLRDNASSTPAASKALFGMSEFRVETFLGAYKDLSRAVGQKFTIADVRNMETAPNLDIVAKASKPQMNFSADNRNDVGSVRVGVSLTSALRHIEDPGIRKAVFNRLLTGDTPLVTDLLSTKNLRDFALVIKDVAQNGGNVLKTVSDLLDPSKQITLSGKTPLQEAKDNLPKEKSMGSESAGQWVQRVAKDPKAAFQGWVNEIRNASAGSVVAPIRP